MASETSQFVKRSTAYSSSPYFEYAGVLMQSPNDLRQHKLIRLPNNMIILCTSDPDASKAAASLSVNVGSFVDPPELQGLAHFLEHAIHLGSDKYPGANEYRAYIQDNHGHENAKTANEQTTYYFTIPHNAFEGALDRLSQLFISPLFDKDYVEREINAVDSESKGILQDYIHQESSVIRSLLDPSHPASMYNCGGIETLSADTLIIREEQELSS
ncbi:metalloprotease [Coemansia brasiliensis]|uniref:Metalloprotease n=1 Tax=Coemansia brasiliensis TaxID=2650707 RepID=A0A9W8M0A8_9FUNG|nr:metalloprotease [Coemansia brasiliensis]